MIDYEMFCKIHALSKEGLSAHQIAAAVALHYKTVQRWVNEETFTQRKGSKRTTLLDPHKATVVRLLQHHEYSAVQVMQKIQEAGYTGGYTI